MFNWMQFQTGVQIWIADCNCIQLIGIFCFWTFYLSEERGGVLMGFSLHHISFFWVHEIGYWSLFIPLIQKTFFTVSKKDI